MRSTRLFLALLFSILLTTFAVPAFGGRRPQTQKILWSEQEQAILDKIKTLRRLPDLERAHTTKQLALQIRQLPAGMNQVRLANSLANLSTEGDFGQDTLQEVATTLKESLRQYPVKIVRILRDGQPAPEHIPVPREYKELAMLVRYEHVDAALDAPQYAEAVAELEQDDLRRRDADFTLSDLEAKTWSLKELRGKVVLVNFWATWCPPCRSEMPDLDALFKQFNDQGLVVLAISDEELAKVQPYIQQHHYSYPILLDPDKKAHQTYNIEGIPKSFVYNREGKLVAQSIDMRTRRQFLDMLGQAGLK